MSLYVPTYCTVFQFSVNICFRFISTDMKLTIKLTSWKSFSCSLCKLFNYMLVNSTLIFVENVNGISMAELNLGSCF